MASKHPLLLGIDIGTSGIKLGLVDAAGRLLATAASPHEVTHPQPGWAEMEADVWLRGIEAALPAACERAGVGPRQIDAVGFSAMFPVFVPIGPDGQPTHPGILYCDQRSMAQADALRQRLDPDHFLQITGNVITPGTCSLTSLLWLKEERPAAFAAARWFAHAGGAVVGALTGEWVTDWTTASLSGLFETCGGRQWSAELCDAAGVPMDKLPPVASPAVRAGAISADAARRFGLRPGIAVAAGAGDTACSTLGLGLVDAGQGCLTCGTTDNLTAVADAPAFDRCFANCCHVTEGKWLFIATMSNTGAALEWFKSNFAAALGAADYDSLFAAAARVEPGAGRAVCLPYFQGERSPVWDANARAVFFGLSLATTPAHLLRALLEGVAFATRQNLDALESCGFAAKELFIAGGGAKSDVWNQIKADALGRSLHRVAHAETTLLGAALLGGVAAGVWDNVAQAAAVAATARQCRVIEPSPDAEKYEQSYRVYRTLYPSLREAFAMRDA